MELINNYLLEQFNQTIQLVYDESVKTTKPYNIILAAKNQVK